MGFRFQKRLKIIPGITLNLSRKGVSTSIGTTGARVTYGHGQQRTTVGIPGTGISHTSIKRTGQNAQPPDSNNPDDAKNLALGIGFIAFLIFLAWLIS